MKHALLIDKRVAGIIRWLERLKQSYSSGALESALMEAECARADLEDLRQDVWSKVMPETHENKIASRIINFSRVAFLSLLIILLAVVPVARDVKISEPEKKSELVLAEPILIIRDYKEEKEEKAVNVKPKKSVSVAKSSVPKKSANVNVTAKVEPTKQNKTVAYDKVFSLVQTGQRALKNNNSVIRIK